MISAFGVEHSGISKMSDDELHHRKRVQAGLSTAGAVVGLSALGAKGVKVGTGRYIKPASRAAKYNAKIDSGVNNALVVGAGVGGASGLNTAAISRKEAGKKHINKADTPTKRRRRRNVGYASSTLGGAAVGHVSGILVANQKGILLGTPGFGEHARAGMIAGGAGGAAAYALHRHKNGEKNMAKSAFGVEHSDIAKGFGGPPNQKQLDRLAPKGRKAYILSKDAAGAGIIGGGVVHMVGTSRYNKGKIGNVDAFAETLGEKKGSKNLSNLSSHSRNIKVGRQLMRGGTAAQVAGLGAAGVATALGSRAKHKKVSKAFDPESRRHTQLGTAAGVAGTTSVVSGASAARSAKKARGHYKMASGANQATKTRLLEGLNLRGAAEAQHAHKTALTHGEMLGHVKAGNAAARKARGKTGVALGAAAAAGAIMHHSNNGAANYVGPYQPKAKYAQGAKNTVGRIKNKIS